LIADRSFRNGLKINYAQNQKQNKAHALIVILQPLF